MSNESKFAGEKQQELDNEQMESVAGGYRPNPAGDGTTEHFFTIEISEGRVASATPEDEVKIKSV